MQSKFMILFWSIIFLFFAETLFCGELKISTAKPTDSNKEFLREYPLYERNACSVAVLSERKIFLLNRVRENVLAQDLLNKALKRNDDQVNGKHLIPYACAMLQKDRKNKKAKQIILKAMQYRQKDNMFTKMRAAQAFFQYNNIFTKEEREKFKQEMTTYIGFFGYGTENHIAMKRIAGLLFSESFPECGFKHAMTGQQVRDECIKYIQKYGRAMYGSSNSEFLSHIYFPVNMEVWTDAWQYSKDPKVHLMAQAILDWFFANAAVNYGHGFVNGSIHRASYGGVDKYKRHALSILLWLFGGEYTEICMGKFPPSIISLVMTDYLPHEAIRNILAEKIKLPYTITQTCANKGYLSKFYQNIIVKENTTWQFPYKKSLFRNTYIHGQYAMGGGNLRMALEEFISIPTSLAFTASWQSTDRFNYLLATHPYWFTKKKWGDKKWGFGNNIKNKNKVKNTYFLDDDMFGFSPFMQMVQKENAAVLFYNIPKKDPFSNYHQKGGSASDRLEELIQECFLYIPETVDERIHEMGMFFIREGKTYIAIIPFSTKADWKESLRKNFFRIGIPGELTGFAIEMGDQKEYGDFEGFKNQFSRNQLELSLLHTNHCAQYHSTRGHVLSLRHTGFNTGLPDASIQGKKINWQKYPTLDSPYVSVKDYVLNVNDGVSGFLVDWSRKYPVYSYYRFKGGKKEFYKKLWVEDGAIKEWNS